MVRPLLGLERDRVRELVDAAGLPFADDETNDDPAFARNRIRAEVLPALRELNPAAERNIAETRAELAEEAALLERVVLEALDAAGAGAGVGRGPGGRDSPTGSRGFAGSRCGRSPSAPPDARSPWGARGRPRSPGSRASPRAAPSNSAAAWSRSASPATSASAPRPSTRRPSRSPWGCPAEPGSAAGRCARSFTPAP